MLDTLIISVLRARIGMGIPFTCPAVGRQVQNDEQAVGGGEEGPPSNPPQLPPGTASRLAYLFASRRCLSSSIFKAKCRRRPEKWDVSVKKGPKTSETSQKTGRLGH